MKKLIFASAALCAAATISAQEAVETQPVQETTPAVSTSSELKAGADRFGAEVGFSFTNGVGLSGGTLNFDYALSDEWLLRLGFGLDVDKSVTDNGDLGKGHSTVSSFEIKPGVAYRFSGTNRLEPYVGAELVYGFGSSLKYSEVSSEGKTTETKSKDKTNYFGANALTGFDFYVAKDLYVGAEVGFGFVVTPKSKTINEVDGKEPEGEKDDTKSHVTSIKAVCNPSIRIGWKF